MVDVGVPDGPETDTADDTVGMFVEPAITTFDPLLSAGVSYIIACGAVVCAAPTIFKPVCGCIWKGP